jgi:hypothetical protein
MWQTVRPAAVTVALLAGMSLIACGQSGSIAGAGATTAAPGPSDTVAQTAGDNFGAGNSPGNSGVQGPAGSPAGYGTPAAGSGGSLIPCSSTPLYISVPCLPVKR